MNWRVPAVPEKVRLIMRSPSHGSIPASDSCGFNFCRSRPLKTASTVQRSAPVRMSDLSARSPSKSCSAPMMIDFPAPVSPVTAIKPDRICHSSASTSARFFIRSRVRMAGIRYVESYWLRAESHSLPTQCSTLKSGLTLTFLGTGTSQGVPMIGCDCVVCQSPDPRDKRLRSSIYIETAECSWVVDTGTDFRTQALRENVRNVDAVIFTHSHTDHIMGFDDLRRFSHARGSMPVYASAETMRDLERVFEFAFNTSTPVPYYLKPEQHVIDGPFKLGETLITPLPVPHGESIVNGYLFSRANQKLVAYLSDCSAVPDAIVDLISGVKVLIIDALRYRPHPTHLSVGQAVEVAALVKPKATYFTHICHDLPQSAESRLPNGVRIAYDGLKLRF